MFNANEELVSAMSAAILSISEHALKELIRRDLKRVKEGQKACHVCGKSFI